MDQDLNLFQGEVTFPSAGSYKYGRGPTYINM